MPAPIWSAPVRFVEVDSQDVVFNAHYLTWCDEAMSAFFAAQATSAPELSDFSVRVRLVTSTQTWHRSARWGDVVAVRLTCPRVGSTSFTLAFDVRVGDEVCCSVETVYVHVGEDGLPTPVPDAVRTVLLASTEQ